MSAAVDAIAAVLLELADMATSVDDATDPGDYATGVPTVREFAETLHAAGLRAARPDGAAGGAELRRDGPVLLIQADTDPGDYGEPRELVEEGTTVLIVPSFALWAAAGAIEERDKLRMVIRNAIDNIAHGRYGHAIRQLRAGRDLSEQNS